MKYTEKGYLKYLFNIFKGNNEICPKVLNINGETYFRKDFVIEVIEDGKNYKNYEETYNKMLKNGFDKN